MSDLQAKEREDMVTCQLIGRGIADPHLLGVFRKVPRHRFVSLNQQVNAYDDTPLPIGQGQTISQPYMVALMTEQLNLKGDETVLEIGTGSGYQTAILAEMAKTVYSIEKYPVLADKAKKLLVEEIGYSNIEISTGDGTLGWSEHASYDAIIITAGAPDVPGPLFEQLTESGRLVIPVGSQFSQILQLVEKREGKMVKKDVCACVFVPLIGEYGWRR